MVKKINDVFNDRDTDVDIQDIYQEKSLELNKLGEITTLDIYSGESDLDMRNIKHPHVYKSNTQNFDSFIENTKLNDIDLKYKNNFIENIITYIKKIKIFSNNRVESLNNKFIFDSVFFKNTGLILIAIFLILFIDKQLVEMKINSGYKKLISIKEKPVDLEYIKSITKSAYSDFNIGSILFLPFLVIPNNNVDNGYNVLQGGKKLTRVIERATDIYTKVNNNIINKGGIHNIEITSMLSDLRNEFSEITGLLYNTLIHYENISHIPNKDLNDKLINARKKLRYTYKFFDVINRDYDVFLSLLGDNSERNYIVLFQNNDEIRPTGGFMGSLAKVTIKKGKITNIQKDDIYAYEWEINKILKNKQLAPEGLNKITKTFGLRDSNYFASFEHSSKLIKSFIDKKDKYIDGLIYINQNTILDFLKENGSIDFPLLGEEITDENFSMIISTLVEAQSFKVGTLSSPKQILFDFTNLFMEDLKKKKNYGKYLDIILKNIETRDLVIYSFNSDENNLLWKLGLNGSIKYSDTLDFTFPFYTSIGGNKSDRYIKYQYNKSIKQNKDCSIDTNLHIYRTHYFSKKEEQKVNKLLDNYPIKDKSRKDILYIQGKGENRAYIRVVLPRDVVVISKPGMNIVKYDNYTQVDYYQTTRVLEKTDYNIEYTLLNKECDDYSYKFYKQPGIREYELEVVDGENSKKGIFSTDFDYNLKK